MNWLVFSSLRMLVSQDFSSPEVESSLLSKRRVCAISDDGQIPDTYR
jgi:hypothetical protein